ncbi:MAG: WD40 repeat domain-containing protein [Armatimonadetes bacterium]|nr:WD40 repeat domain-containing protein [Armatimonadota bacterium]MDW8027691.1 WD40 repeat domain-containing protein [Armatimonadota bacterium]
MWLTLTPQRHRIVRYEEGLELRLVSVLPEHEGSVTSVAFSTNGRIFASASRDGTVRFWELPEFQKLFVVVLGYPALAISFSPDSQWLAIGSYGGKVNFCRINDQKIANVIELGQEVVQSVAFSPKGDWLAIGSGVWNEKERKLASGKLRVWNELSESFVNIWEDFQAPVSSVAFSPEGSLIAASSWDGQLRVWNAAEGSLRYTLTAHTGWVRCIAFSPNGNLIATAGFSLLPLGSWWETPIPLWSAKDGTLLSSLRVGTWGFIRGHRGPISAVAFSPNGQLIASGGNDKTVKVWSVEGRLLCSLEGHIGLVNTVAFSTDGQYIASGDSNGTILVWRICRI